MTLPALMADYSPYRFRGTGKITKEFFVNVIALRDLNFYIIYHFVFACKPVQSTLIVSD